MSASLVGSEMCIRDRYASGVQWDPAANQGGGTNPRQRLSPPQARWRCTTVSYTHLTLPTICSV
eukprot:10919275-Alexandrium_andersonii.AAC.1